MIRNNYVYTNDKCMNARINDCTNVCLSNLNALCLWQTSVEQQQQQQLGRRFAYIGNVREMLQKQEDEQKTNRKRRDINIRDEGGRVVNIKYNGFVKS